ncbi:DNA glycosylase AlkZ-like family protein [Corynebacterium pacaense]|uniref:DNA glycosylase AlkZ-like family protein n=1 Tax=Corynebacterium pacaense TaxID=1816684 RepID=UPI0009BB9962|nr:crosslink repair DNA glycosylase YcaQ family protein [Corynebacterium pacaense]
MSRPLPLDRLRALRLVGQLLAASAAGPRGSVGAGAVGVASHMLATQAQQRTAAINAIDLRNGSAGAAEALASSQLIRSWSQRGTHQLLAACDVRWMTLLCSPRVLAASAKRRPALGLDDAAVDRARDALFAACTEPVTRDTAYGLFASVGVDPQGGRGQHLLRHFGGEGEIVQGPPVGGGDTFVLLDAIAPGQHDLHGDAALQEVTGRYLGSRGAAGVKDLQWWTGLTVREVRRGLSIIESAGEAHRVDGPSGEQLWIPAWAEDVSAAEVEAALGREITLPAFDEYLLSYSDRSHVMDPAHQFSIGPGRNGIFKPFRVVRGEALPL